MGFVRDRYDCTALFLRGGLVGNGRGVHSLGSALIADRALANTIFHVLATRVTPAEDGGGDAGGVSL
jgi:hypothetical protein